MDRGNCNFNCTVNFLQEKAGSRPQLTIHLRLKEVSISKLSVLNLLETVVRLREVSVLVRRSYSEYVNKYDFKLDVSFQLTPYTKENNLKVRSTVGILRGSCLFTLKITEK